MTVADYMRGMLASPTLGPQVAGHKCLPGADARFAEPRRPWPAAIARLLEERGISLYSHQALATDHIRAGHHVVVSTPTASGKSLIYNLPVLEKHLLDPDARAIYLFPLKALAQDQLAGFNALTESWPQDARPTAALYDGDTPDSQRAKIRKNPPDVLLTNPEMLHLGILPYHESWAAFLAGLSIVVVDEAHTYRGVFGSHMAQVFRRLNRLCARYGARPTYVLCTATVGNPQELGQALVGQDVVVIDQSGAPSGPRHYSFINPELSASTVAIDLLKGALARNLRTIVYCRSRRMTELISLWAGSQAGPYKNRISAYRAGFLPEERRAIEARMASGELLCVVSTSALELGIDIGGLDICILVGYPGTIMATMQRGGRVGRAQQEAAVLVVAGEDALDQYFARNTEEFFRRPPEKAVVNPDNEVILARHLECAAAELPLQTQEDWLQRPEVARCVRDLGRMGKLLQSADGREWLTSRKKPQRQVDLRGCGQSFVIEDDKGAVIGTVDGFRAWRETHEGAVYLHRGRSYVIQHMDVGRGRIVAKEEQVGWFTRTRGQKSTVILEECERAVVGRALVCRGRLRITDTITGYEKRSVSGNRLLTIVPLDCPPQVFETEGLWFVVPDAIRRAMEDEFLHFMGSIHAMEHAVIGFLPLQVLADRNDFGGISIPLHPQLGHAAVFVYDGLPGGAGLTRQAFATARDVLAATCQAVGSCDCEDGCPSCVHSPKCGSGNRPISKQGALVLMRELLADGPEGRELFDTCIPSPAQDDFLDVPAPQGASGSTARPGDMRVDVADNAPASATLSHMSASQALASGTGDAPTPQAPPARYLVFDVETRRSATEVGGWHRADLMGVSVVVAYDSADDQWLTYGQDDLADLFARMRQADAVVGYNSLRFDYAVLRPFAPFDLHDLPEVDLLRRVQEHLSYRLKLDNLGQATLGAAKSADGLQALAWWKEGRIDEIAAYCRKDVELTRNLYLYGLEHGHVLFTNKAGQKARIQVDFAPRSASRKI